MWPDVPLLPVQGSSGAGAVDALTLAALGVSVLAAGLVLVLLVVFVVRYRRTPERRRADTVRESRLLELGWTLVPLAVLLGLYAWGLRVFVDLRTPPDEAVETWVVAKQWMWKFQHPEGRREIDELHVPVGVPVRLRMTSEDVVHSFFVPAFRVKADVLPGRYTTVWFEADEPGTYDLLCAEYCGTEHSLMRGTVVVQSPAEHARWLEGAGAGEPLHVRGARRFEALACGTCHGAEATQRGPSLEGLAGSEVRLADGRTVVADDAYLRRAILDPAAEVVAGHDPIMPTYRGQVDEEALLELIAYLRRLGEEPP